MLEGGYHLILDLEGCHSRRLDSRDAMLGLCTDVARILGAEVVSKGVHRFSPRGVTAFVVIAESHISVHTWPEAGKAFLDIFCCKEKIPVERVLDHVQGALGAKRGRLTVLLRDTLLSRLLFSGRLPVESYALDFGKSIFSTDTPFQRIELTKGPMGVSLFLDGYWQFVERYEHIYHETLVHPALVCAPRLGRVAIGGGGDGLALREILRYPGLGRVWMYELDPTMLEVARRHPEMIRLNRRALEHPKASVVAADAQKLLNPRARLDSLILDFPSVSDGRKFLPLYHTDLYRKAKQALAPDGVLVTQATDFPHHVERAARNLGHVFPYVLPVQANVGRSVFTYILASRLPLRQRRSLPGGLRFVGQSTVEGILAATEPGSGDGDRRLAGASAGAR